MNEVDVNVKGTDNVSSVLSGVAGNTEKMSQRAGKAIAGLGEEIGGSFGAIVTTAGDNLENFGEKAHSGAQKAALAGGVIAGLGVALGEFGSADKAAEQQLDAAISAAGETVDEYSKQIDNAISKGEDFGHSAADVQNALTTLTVATGDEATALKYMTLVENLAAEKHTSLAAAAQQVARVLGGNTRLLKQFNIEVGTGKLTTDQLTAALAELSTKLTGQAAAASDTFGGKIESVKEHVEGWVAQMANRVAPAMTFAGTAIGIVGSVVDIMAARSEKASVATLALAESEDKATASGQLELYTNRELAASNEAVAASAEEATVANKGSAMGAIGAGGALTALAVGGYAAGMAIGHLVDGGKAWISTLKDMKSNVTDLSSAVMADGGAIGQTSQQWIGAKLQADGLADKAAKVGISLGDLITATGGTDDQFKQLVQTWTSAGKPSNDTILSLILLHDTALKAADGGNKLSTAISGVTDASINADIDLRTLGHEVDTSSAEFKEGATAVKDLDGAITSFSDDLIGATESQDKFRLGLDGLKASLKGNGSQLEGNSLKAIANRDALLDQITALNGVAQSQLKAGISTQAVTVNMAANEAALRKTALAAGLNTKQVDALIKKYALVPKNVATSIIIHDEAALAAIKTVEGQLDYLAGLETTDLASYNTIKGTFNQFTLAGIKGKMTGGISTAATGGQRGNLVRINEEGGEVVDLPNGSHVNSRADSISRFGGRGAAQVTVGIHLAGGDTMFLTWLRSVIRVNGGDVQAVLGSR